MKITEMYPATFVKGEHLTEPAYAATIVSVAMEELTAPNQEPETKPVVTFDRPIGSAGAKKLVLNKTNTLSIAAALDSEESDAWEGQEITLIRQLWQGKPVVRIAE